MKIYGFYNVGMINNWWDVYTKQINNIINTVLNETKILYINFLGSEENYMRATKYIKDYKNIITTNIPDIYAYDYPLLVIIKELAKKEEFYCYYIHSKGVTQKDNEAFYGYTNNFEHLYACVDDWRIYMEYFILERYSDCIKKLDEGYDCCGVNWCTEPEQHFSGNFWWATSACINKLPEPMSLDTSSRFPTESWIGIQQNPKVFEFYKNDAGYRNRLDHNIYREKINTEDELIVVIDSGKRKAGLGSYIMQAVHDAWVCDTNNIKFYINYTHDMLYQDNNIQNPNIWEYYFTQPLGFDEIKDSKNLKAVELMDGFVQRFTKNHFNEYNRVFNKYFTISKLITDKVDEFYNENFKDKKILSIHKRGTDHYKDGMMLDAAYYIEKVDEELNNDTYDLIFLCTDEIKTLETFKKKYFNKVIYYNSLRVDSNKGIHYSEGLGNPYKMGEEVLVESLLLSKSDFLIRGVSNVTNMALVFNPELKNRVVDLHIKYN